MRQQITVDKAIKRGHLIVNVPVFIAIIGCPALALYLEKQNLIPGWGIGIAFIRLVSMPGRAMFIYLSFF